VKLVLSVLLVDAALATTMLARAKEAITPVMASFRFAGINRIYSLLIELDCIALLFAAAPRTGCQSQQNGCVHDS